MVSMKIVLKKMHEQSIENDIPGTPEERLDLVEQLRIEAGKFLYDYPTAFRRIITIVRKEQR